MSWEPVHYSAQWTPENPAPEWWAQFDLSWQIDRDDVMSERKLAAFLGWNRRSAVTLLEEVGAVLGIREPKAGQKRATTRKVAVPEVSQSGTVESGELLDRGAKVEPEVSQVWAKSEPPRARAFPLPEAESDSEADSEKKEIHVPLEPARPHSEPPCAPPPVTPPSAPGSTAKAATNTQPALFGQAIADTAESQKPAKKAHKQTESGDVAKVWAHFRQWHPLTKEAVPKGDGAQIAVCLQEWTADEIMSVFTWAHTSTQKDAVWLREHDRDCVKTLTVQADFGRRLELAMKDRQGVKGSAEAGAKPAPAEDPGTIFDALVARRGREGTRIVPDDLPIEVVQAINAIGGWYQMGLINQFDMRAKRAAFIVAYNQRNV